jgi:predicted nucleic acid-binding protein
MTLVVDASVALKWFVEEKQVEIVAGRASGTFVALTTEDELAERASQIAVDLEHPAYDCFYLALAEREAAALVTADRRLVERVRATPWEGRVVALDAWGAPA